MDITFNYQNWLSRYYAWVFGVNPPNWLCPFFWLIIFLVALSPIILIVKGFVAIIRKIPAQSKKRAEYLKNETTEQYQRRHQKNDTRMKIAQIIGKVIFGIVLLFYAGIIIYALYLSMMAYDFHDWMIRALILLGGLVAIAGVLIGVGWAVFKTFTSNAANTVYHLIGMAYHTVCPHITWVGTPPVKSEYDHRSYDTGYSDAEDAGA